MPTPLQLKAAEFAKYLSTKLRGEKTIVIVRDGAPSWVRDVCQACHADGSQGGMLPDDWRYQFIAECTALLVEDRNPDEIQLEADIYNYNLLSWLESRNDRYVYVDEVRSEYGSGESVMTDISLGQYKEKEEVLYLLREALEELCAGDGEVES